MRLRRTKSRKAPGLLVIADQVNPSQVEGRPPPPRLLHQPNGVVQPARLLLGLGLDEKGLEGERRGNGRPAAQRMDVRADPLARIGGRIRQCSRQQRGILRRQDARQGRVEIGDAAPNDEISDQDRRQADGDGGSPAGFLRGQAAWLWLDHAFFRSSICLFGSSSWP